MRVGFAGTPEFAARALGAVHESGYTIPRVLTQPDRPSGRGMALRLSPVKKYAKTHGLDVEQPASLRSDEVQRALRAVELDVLVVAAYGLILPQAVLDWPRHGCLNIHASLLPRWRGAAPIARAIEAGDTVTGITIMRMDAGLDTGPVVLSDTMPIGARETAGTLHERLASAGARLIVDVLRRLEVGGTLPATPQPERGVTYAAKLERADRIVRWTAPAAAIDRQVRALTPAPGAVAEWRGAPVRIVVAEPVPPAASAAGTVASEGSASRLRGGTASVAGEVVAVAANGIDVRCGDGAVLRLVALQPAGGRAMPAAAFAAGRGIVAGTRFAPGAP